MTVPEVADVVSMSGASAVTSTVCVTAPTSSCTSICLLSATWSVMPVRSAVLKPAAATEKLYRPGNRKRTVQLHWALVRVCCLTPVSAETTTISASGTVAPWGSKTAPPRVARTSCARAGIPAAQRKATMGSSESTAFLDMWGPSRFVLADVCELPFILHADVAQMILPGGLVRRAAAQETIDSQVDQRLGAPAHHAVMCARRDADEVAGLYGKTRA